ncbi:hypothetical protein J3R30DRAFT_3741541 [Lentinula aciculospora]|uniref:Uncharacterized protein n=1 Tax=Lentinula aciculospora TaxID=153920 RepID=A0A9W8ZUB9_9AGAR|nr:hypothetical protein J3R30DRAFT_3741541 [Lentinula aciculospora]
MKLASLALVATVISTVSSVLTADSQQATICAVCSKTIAYAGLTRTLTLAKEEESNTLQCNYDTPAIAGFNPACLYANIGGDLIFSNAGSACPNPASTVVQSATCTTAPL